MDIPLGINSTTGSKRYGSSGPIWNAENHGKQLQGVPLRLEIGPNDIAKRQTLTVRRDTGVKCPVLLADIASTVSKLLDSIQNDMFTRARDTYYSRLKEITRWEDVVPALDDKNVVVLPWCEVEACEDDIKERSGRA